MTKEKLEKLMDFHYEKFRYYERKIEELALKEYDDNRVYRTGERQLDTRIDGSIMLQ